MANFNQSESGSATGTHTFKPGPAVFGIAVGTHSFQAKNTNKTVQASDATAAGYGVFWPTQGELANGRYRR